MNKWRTQKKMLVQGIGTIKVTISLLGSGRFPDIPLDDALHYKYRVTLSQGGRRTGYIFWGSAQAYMDNRPKLTGDDIEFVVECFLNDAVLGYEPYEVFCGELGYSQDDPAAKRIYQACRKTAEKTRRLGWTRADIEDALRDLREREYNFEEG